MANLTIPRSRPDTATQGRDRSSPRQVHGTIACCMPDLCPSTHEQILKRTDSKGFRKGQQGRTRVERTSARRTAGGELRRQIWRAGPHQPGRSAVPDWMLRHLGTQALPMPVASCLHMQLEIVLAKGIQTRRSTCSALECSYTCSHSNAKCRLCMTMRRGHDVGRSVL